MKKHFHPSPRQAAYWDWILECYHETDGWVAVGDSCLYDTHVWNHINNRPCLETLALVSGAKLDMIGTISYNNYDLDIKAPKEWPYDISDYALEKKRQVIEAFESYPEKVTLTGFFNPYAFPAPFKLSWLMEKTKTLHTDIGLPIVLPKPQILNTVKYVQDHIATGAHNKIKHIHQAQYLTNKIRILMFQYPIEKTISRLSTF